MSEKIPFQDRTMARALEIGSNLAVRFPGLIGKAFAPDGVAPRRWYASSTPASEVTWKTVQGTADSGYRPPNYKQGVVLQGSGVDMMRLRYNFDVSNAVIRPAAAYALGGAIMATELYWMADDQENMAAVFGVGRGPLHAQLGLFNRETRAFTQHPDVHIPVPPNEINAILERFPAAQRV